MNKSVYNFLISLIIYFVLRGITYFLKWDHWILNIALIMFALFMGSFFSRNKYGIIVSRLSQNFITIHHNNFRCLISVKGTIHHIFGSYKSSKNLSDSQLQYFINTTLNKKEHLDSFEKYITQLPENSDVLQEPLNLYKMEISNPENMERLTVSLYRGVDFDKNEF